MFEKGFPTWAFVLGLSFIAGTLRYWGCVIQGRKFSVRECLLELLTSAFVSIVVYMLCTGCGLTEYIAISLSGVASYFGTRALSLVFNFVEDRANPSHKE
jgi:hypothetical protein